MWIDSYFEPWRINIRKEKFYRKKIPTNTQSGNFERDAI